jgi:malonyl-CoA decarboxylase
MSDADQPAPPIDKASRSTDPARRPSPNEKRPTAQPFFRRILGSFGRPTAPRPSASVRDARHAISMCHELLSERGEVSSARLAADVLDAYQSLEAPALEAFFDLLVDQFSPKPEEVVRAAEAYREESSQANLIRLQAAVESPRQELFRRFNMAPGGTGVLVEMRKQLLRTLAEHPRRAGLDADLTHLFKSWFNRGFLVLQRIDWRTSALILERLIQYEAVHEIQGWRDLHRRLEADRRCYAFFHPALPEEPLIFIEVALTKGMSSKVQPLLETNSPIVDPASADCAIFYSITNCQEGLRGVSFGNLLIKQVAEDLGREFPRLKTFATLSPIPGFRKWLVEEAAARIGQAEHEQLATLLAKIEIPSWFKDPRSVTLGDVEEQQLTRLCADYLLHAKSRSDPLDPVERFHLGNGARLERLNWMADTSPNGMRRSAGMMVNYVYRLAEVERNHEAYARVHQVIASRRFVDLAKESLLAEPATAKA